MRTDKAVLLIAHAFPPVGGISVQRPLKFARYLHQYGWVSTVLSSSGTYSATMDPGLLSEIPEWVEVVRQPDLVSKLIGRVVSGTSYGESSRHSPTDGRVTINPTSLTVPHRTFKQVTRTSLKRFLKRLKSIALIPDEHIFWAFQASIAGRRLVRLGGVRCIYTTSGPNSTHLVGLCLKLLTNVKWVADFRDPWTNNLHYEHRGIRNRFEQFLERCVLERADAVVTVTESFKSGFESKYPFLSGKTALIRNGVDPEDFPPLKKNSNGGVFTFFYAGILYGKRSPAPFLLALSRALRHQRLNSSDIQVEFAGVFDYPGSSQYLDMIVEFGLTEVVRICGYLSRREALAKMQSADALLLFGDRGEQAKQYIPGKLYEYLYAGPPILAILAPDGEAASVLTNARAGSAFSPEDVDAIVDEIVRLVTNRRKNVLSFVPNRSEIEKYSRQSQTMQLAALMDDLTSREDESSG